jgi:phthalate 4,5-dioxygenase oxygenase subunit
MALQEGMGKIVDRSKEHLGTSDKAIIACRQLLLEAVDAVEAGGTPRAVDPSTYERVRPYDAVVPPGKTWETEFANELIAKF